MGKNEQEGFFMMIGAAKGVFFIVVGYLALVGLVQICVTLSRWFSGAGGLEHCWLVVAATPGDHGIEMRLRQAYSQTVAAPALEGVRMAVVEAGADEETLRICQCFCQEKGLPLLPAGEMERLVERDG